MSYGLLLLSFIICGRLLGWTALGRTVSIPQDKQTPFLCDGTIRENPVFANNGWRFDVALEACGEGITGEVKPARGNIRLFSPELYGTFESGDRVRFLAKIKKPRQFKNPGSFNYPRYLLTQGIGTTGSLVGPKWIIKTSDGSRLWLSRVVAYARKKIDGAITRIPSPLMGEGEGGGDAAGLLRAIVIGKRDDISEGMRDAFSRTGLAHLLSISGLHVGYVALIVFFAVRLLLGFWPRISLRWPLPRVSALVSLPAVWFYVAVAGFPVSAVRAAIMITIFLFALFFLWRRDLLSALAAAVFVILVAMPASAFSISFQLSVICVFAIITLTPIIEKQVDRLFRWRRLSQMVAVTIAATLGSAPLVASNFNFISGLGVVANIVAVPFTGIVLMPLAVAASLFTLMYAPIGAAIWKMASVAAAILLRYVSFLNQHGAPLVFSWAPSIAEVLLAYAAILIVVFWNRLSYRRLIAGALTGFIILDVGFWHLLPIMNRKLEVTFLDVGHGDSIVVCFPNNRVMLIDGGGIKGSDFDVGRNVVSPALLRMGIHKVDTMILTHPHHDHYKGLAAIAQQFNPQILYTNGGDAPEEEMLEWGVFLASVKDSGIPIQPINGTEFLIEEGGAKVEIFAHNAKDVAVLDPNDASLVVRISYGNKSFLLTGDLMEVGEKMLFDGRSGISSDVLKIGHHGSETSSSQMLLNAVKPSIAVISVGENNQYGVPDNVVLDRLQKIGSRIYRTDLDGAITVKTDGKYLDVDTFVKNPKHQIRNSKQIQNSNDQNSKQ